VLVDRWSNDEHPEATLWACRFCRIRFYPHDGAGRVIKSELETLRLDVLAVLRGEPCRVPADRGENLCEVHLMPLGDGQCEDYPTEKMAVLALIEARLEALT
jgi:hypothetical protein